MEGLEKLKDYKGEGLLSDMIGASTEKKEKAVTPTKKKRRLLFLDLETTGLKMFKNGILEFAYIIYDEDKQQIITKGETYVKPASDVQIDYSAMKINKIDLDEVEKKGITELEFIDKFLKLIKDYDIKYIVSWGGNFDVNMIRGTFIRNKIEYPKHLKSYDLKQDFYFYSDTDYYSLSNITKEFKTKTQPTHRALADVEATFELYQILKG